MANQGNESIVRGTTGTGISLVQTGWRVTDSEGDVVGMVVGRDGTSMKVDLQGGAGEQVEVPTQLIAEEDEEHMHAVLAVTSDELMQTMPGGERAG
jgi:hypothetical protein